MKIAMHEITTKDGTFAEHLAAYAKTGWRHFEINFWKAWEFIGANGIEATAKIINDHGLKCVAATGLGLGTFRGEEARRDDLEQMKKFGEVMQALGCRPLVTGSDAPPGLNRENYSQNLDVLAEHVNAVAEVAESYGVQLAIEMNWCSLCKSLRTATELVRRVNRENVGFVWDFAHFFATPSRLSDLDLCRGKIFHSHLNDVRETFIEVMDINGDRVLPGEGILPMREWVAAVEGHGFNGYHSLELFNEELWALDLETLCRRSMEACRKVWVDAEF